jgi:hypothetical protein
VSSSLSESRKPLESAPPARGESHRLKVAKATLGSVPNRETVSEAERIHLRERRERESHARILRVVQHVVGKNRDEMALWLGIDPRQLGRWYKAEENPQMWRYHRDPTLRRTLRLVEALDDTDGATVETTIRARLNLGTDGVGE